MPLGKAAPQEGPTPLGAGLASTAPGDGAKGPSPGSTSGKLVLKVVTKGHSAAVYGRLRMKGGRHSWLSERHSGSVAESEGWPLLRLKGAPRSCGTA